MSSSICSEAEQLQLPTYDELSADDTDSIARRKRAMATSSNSDGISDSYMNGSGMQRQQQQVLCTLTFRLIHTHWCIIHKHRFRGLYDMNARILC
jgi:hypothetical protein